MHILSDLPSLMSLVGIGLITVISEFKLVLSTSPDFLYSRIISFLAGLPASCFLLPFRRLFEVIHVRVIDLLTSLEPIYPYQMDSNYTTGPT